MGNLRIFIIMLAILGACKGKKQHTLTHKKKERTIITRERISTNSLEKVAEICFENNQKIWKKHYASNNWQVLDSVAYTNEQDIVYTPNYDQTRRLIAYTRKESKEKETNLFEKHLNDRHQLSEIYMKELNTIHSLLGTEVIPNHKMITNFIPSIFTAYGIPHSELLDSCEYAISTKGFIQHDTFYFKHYTLRRAYEYDQELLKKVKITILDHTTNQSRKLTERFSTQMM